MERLYQFNFDIKESSYNTNLPEIEFFQGDVGACTLTITLMDAGTPVDLTGLTAKMAFKYEGGGEGLTEDIVTDAAAGKVSYTLRSTDLVPGKNTAWIQTFRGSEKRFTTIPFHYTVYGDPVNPEARQGSNQYYDIEQILNDFNYKGEYSADTAYKKYNIVAYEGSSYIAKRDTIGNAPPDVDLEVENEYWGLSAKIGDTSDIFEKKNTYSPGVTYAENDLVNYNGSSFLCLKECTGITPEDGSEYWMLLSAAGPNFVSESTPTNLEGILKGDGENIKAAVRGTDYAKSDQFTVTLYAGDWVNGEITVQNEKIYSATCPGDPKIAQSATDEQAMAWWNGMIRVVGQAVGSITLRAIGDVPTIDIPIEIEVR